MNGHGLVGVPPLQGVAAFGHIAPPVCYGIIFSKENQIHTVKNRDLSTPRSAASTALLLQTISIFSSALSMYVSLCVHSLTLTSCLALFLFLCYFFYISAFSPLSLFLCMLPSLYCLYLLCSTVNDSCTNPQTGSGVCEDSCAAARQPGAVVLSFGIH